VKPYYRLEFGPGPDPRPVDEEEFLARLGETLRAAVKRRLMSDVPLGAFLSGGLDSSVVVALMAGLSDRPVRTFSIGFEERGYSELEDARAVARHLSTDHTETIVRPSAFEILPELVWHCDEPFGTAPRCRRTTSPGGQGARDRGALRGRRGRGVRRLHALPHRRDREAWRSVPRWLGQGVAGSLTRLLPVHHAGWNVLANLAYVSGRGRISGMGIYPYIRDVLYTAEWRRRALVHDPVTRWTPPRACAAPRRREPAPVPRYAPLSDGDILTRWIG